MLAGLVLTATSVGSTFTPLEPFAGTVAAATDADTCIATREESAGGTFGDTAVHISNWSGQRVGATHRALAFSPDGSRILYAVKVGNDYALVTARLDGTDERRAYTYPSSATLYLSQKFVWSSDGRHIAFITGIGVQSTERLTIVDAGASTPTTTFTSPFRVTFNGFDISPDGTKVAYTDASGTFENDLWIANTNGSGSPTRILDNVQGDTSLPPWSPPKDIEDIRWSPDGATIAFAGRNGISASPGGVFSSTAAYWELYLVDPDGTDLREIAVTPVGQVDQSRRYPTWSPDSTKVAFTWGSSTLVNSRIVLSNGISYYTIGTGAVTNLPNATNIGAYPGGRMEWSPSGSAIVSAGTYIPPEANTGEHYYGVYVFPIDGSPKIELESHSTQASLVRGLVSLVPCSAVQPGVYDALVPARLLETRPGYSTTDGQFNGIGVRAAGSVTELLVTGRGGVPADATAVVLNVAVTGALDSGYITVFPCGSDRPTAANLNYAAGDTIPNLVIAKIGDGGKVCLYTYAATDLIADVNGAFGPGTNYLSLNPARVLETRPGYSTADGQFNGIGLQPAGSVVELTVADRAGVPADATAVVLNIAVTGTEGPGYITVYPCGAPRPTAANLNYGAGDTIPNLVIAKIGVGGKVCLYTYAATHLIADVNGAFPAKTSYVPLVPARVYESRTGQPTFDGNQDGTGKRSAGSVTQLSITNRAGVPNDASAVVLNIAVTEAEAPGYLTIYPCGSPRPTAANLNYGAGDTIPNLVVAGVGDNGFVCIYTYARTHLVIDVNGTFPDYR